MFNNRYVRTIMLSRVLLQLGVWVRNFAILLYVTDMTNNDPLSVSLIAVAEYAPIFLFAVIGGTFADRWKPKRTMVWCDVLSAASIFGVLLVLLFGSWQALFFATLLSAVLSQFSQPSAMKLFKQHVPGDKLQGVMAMFQTLMAFFMVIGPIAGTFVFQKFGIEVSLVATGVLFAGSALILAFLPADEELASTNGKASFMRETKEGLRYVWNNRTLRSLGGAFAVSGLAIGLIQPLLLFVAIENLGRNKDFLQWLLMANGAATLVGGALVMKFAKKVQPQSLLVFGLFISAAGTFGIGWSTSVPLTIALEAVNGLFYPCIMVGINTLMMKNTSAAFMGRVGGVMTPMLMGFMVVGMGLAGTVKDAFTLFAPFTASAFLFLVGAIILLPLLSSGGKTSAERAGI